MGGDLNVVHAAQLARVRDRGGPRRGDAQGVLDLVADGAVAIRDGRIVAVGTTDEVLAVAGDPGVETLDATGRLVLPGLVECHCHPLFAGERHDDFERRLAPAGPPAVPASPTSPVGGRPAIASSVVATRAAGDDELRARLAWTYARALEGGATTLEVKSGYGQTTASELHHLSLLDASRATTPLDLRITFLGAHIVPPEASGPAAHTDLVVGSMLPQVVEAGIADFHDIVCERDSFDAPQARRLLEASRTLGIPTRTHTDIRSPSEGWVTSVEGGAVSAEHLTFTPEAEIRDVGAVDTVAVVLPVAELLYLTSQRAPARTFVDAGVPLAIATDFCSSLHATSLVATIGLAVPWFRLSPGEAIVAASLNAAYGLGVGQDRGSIDPGKRGDLTVVGCSHPTELCLQLGQSPVTQVVIDGRVVHPPGPDRRPRDPGGDDARRGDA